MIVTIATILISFSSWSLLLAPAGGVKKEEKIVEKENNAGTNKFNNCIKKQITGLHKQQT
jgi:hypothetical protein